MSARLRALADSLSVIYDQFARTTNPQHKEIVRDLLQKTFDHGDSYFKTYEGFYSTRAEQFVTEKDMVNGEWPEIYGEVVPLKKQTQSKTLGKNMQRPLIANTRNCNSVVALSKVAGPSQPRFFDGFSM